MDKVNPENKQASKYDKILHENIETALPGLIKNVLGIHIVHSEALPDNVQHTDNMEPVSSFFKTENDIFYRRGEEKGLKKGIEKGREEGVEEKSYAVVKNLLMVGEFTISQVANYVGVTEAFVRKIRRSLNSN